MPVSVVVPPVLFVTAPATTLASIWPAWSERVVAERLPLRMTPADWVTVVAVRVFVPRSTVPAVVRLGHVSAPPRLSVPEEPTVTEAVAARRLSAVVASVPPLTTVAPANVLAPERVSVLPLPAASVSAPLLMTPEIVTGL